MTMAEQLGGEVESGHEREFGRAEVTVGAASPLLAGVWKPGERHVDFDRPVEIDIWDGVVTGGQDAVVDEEGGGEAGFDSAPLDGHEPGDC